MSKRDKCKHGLNGTSWGQAYSLSKGFVYEDEIKLYASDVRCMICGATLDEPIATAKGYPSPLPR